MFTFTNNTFDGLILSAKLIELNLMGSQVQMTKATV